MCPCVIAGPMRLRRAKHATLVPPHQVFKCFGVPGQRAVHQRDVVAGHPPAQRFLVRLLLGHRTVSDS